jgi:hypothetical protein
MSKDIITTCGERFTEANSRELARLVFVRFGRDSAAALSAWRRLLQNSCTLDQFFDLIGRDWLNVK